jgi:hypothetical protein
VVVSQNTQNPNGEIPGERLATLRITRGKYYTDSLRAYKIIIDGETAGRIKRNEVIEVPITPGLHKVVLKIDWCRSNELEVKIEERQSLDLVCGSPMTGWRILLHPIYGIFLRNRYLWLRESN